MVPFTLPEVRRWPAVATEFAPAAALPAEYAGTHVLEIENRANAGQPCLSPALPAGCRPAPGRDEQPFRTPGSRSLYGMPAGKGNPRDNPYLSAGSFEYGVERRAALLRLPWSTLALQGVSTRDVFLRIRPDEF